MDVLYLDFDNVLHGDVLLYPLRPETAGQVLFENAPVLEQLLEPYPDLKIVLSTSWVRQLGFTRARKALPPSLHKRVIGATYHRRHMREEEFARLTRYEQIVADVARRSPTRWLAIDDDLEGWPEHALKRVVPMPLVVGLGEIWPPIIFIRGQIYCSHLASYKSLIGNPLFGPTFDDLEWCTSQNGAICRT